MKPEAKDLVLAILARIKERDGIANKTKLLKLLYLADIEHFRKAGETLTGFNWLFHLFGPWSAEYDQLIEDLARTDSVQIEEWNAASVSGARIRPLETRDLNDLIRDTDEYYRIQRQIDFWADRALSEMLDYVYFETEPMSDAVSGDALRFEKIRRESPVLYRRAKSETHPEAVKRLKVELQEMQREAVERRITTLRDFRKPIFDDVYAAALAELDEQENRRT